MSLQNNPVIDIIVTHRLYPGAGQDLYKYHKDNGMPALLVEHSFMSHPDRVTTFSFYNGRIENIRDGINFRFLPELICYFKDFVYTLSAALRYPCRFRFYIGCGGFNVLAGFILKLFGRVEKVIFYTIDFVPRRFKNPVLNDIYMLIDRICVSKAHRTWNLNQRMAEGRQMCLNMPIRKFNRQRVVPIGIWPQNLPEIRKNIVKDKKLIFCGDLTETQGVDLVLECIADIVRVIPDFKFVIIGDGNYKEVLSGMTRRLNIISYVDFLGAIYEPKALYTQLCAARAGVAAYKETPGSSVYFADVTKPKTYLSCGLPVIITKIPAVSIEIFNRKMGIVIDYKKADLVDAVLKVMTDDDFYLKCKHNAQDFISDLNWNKIFSTAIEEVKNG